MQLGKSQRTNQFLESLKAEGEVILEDVQPKAGHSRSVAPPPTDPITLTVEEKLNVMLKRDGGVGNFDVQGTLSLQILNAEDGHVQVQVPHFGMITFVSFIICLEVYSRVKLKLINSIHADMIKLTTCFFNLNLLLVVAIKRLTELSLQEFCFTLSRYD